MATDEGEELGRGGLLRAVAGDDGDVLGAYTLSFEISVVMRSMCATWPQYGNVV